MSEREWISLVVCFVLVLCHWTASRVKRAVEPFGPRAASFAGGAAATYVFLTLYPEIDKTHRIVGHRIHLVLLGGFVLILAIDVLLNARRGEKAASRFGLHIGLAAVYNFLLAYTMAEQLPMSAFSAGTYAVALGLHILSQDVGLVELFEQERFDRYGRHALIVAVVLGWLLSVVSEPPEVFLDILTAAVAGFITYRVFAEELPDRTGIRIRWFLFGVLTYTALELLAGR